MDKLKSLLLSGAAVLLLASCGMDTPEDEQPMDNNPAYVAVGGVVYDVTGVDGWAGGKHVGELTAPLVMIIQNNLWSLRMVNLF